MPEFFAHTSTATPWEPLYTGCRRGGDCRTCAECPASCGHLDKTARLCAQFAEAMYGKGDDAALAHVLGKTLAYLHDAGKFSQAFQSYLRHVNGVEGESGGVGRVDHSTAGAVYAAQMWRENAITQFYADLLALAVGGHHSGLADAAEFFNERLKKEIPPWRAAFPENILPPAPVSAPFLLKLNHSAYAGFASAFLGRMLFSCLVDADFLATEAFCSPEKHCLRPRLPADILPRMNAALARHCEARFGTPQTDVDIARVEVRAACLRAAALAPGFFSLTVPTGGGKTLSSLAFALAHAVRHGLRRVVYVIPYTSIIEQNARVFEKVFEALQAELGMPLMLEHHSNLEPERETEQTKLAAENWELPLVVTTNVQFFESLFAARPSRCRKLHNLARSVVIFDEAQAFPSKLLSPILRATESLVRDFGASIVWCSATQPPFETAEGFSAGIARDSIREIIPDVPALFARLRRVSAHRLGTLTTEAFIDRVRAEGGNGALIVVNETKTARETFCLLRDAAPHDTLVAHLSAHMCPAHRLQTLDRVREALARKARVWLVSTQLIEAGVDVSFPTVFRQECGLDSFAQAAGRCNRNGELGVGTAAGGRVFFFALEAYPARIPELRRRRDVTLGEIFNNYAEADSLSLEALQCFFRQFYFREGARNWDDKEILGNCGDGRARAISFAKIAETFSIIDSPAKPVVVPWGQEGERLLNELYDRRRFKIPPDRELFRALQRFTINVYPNTCEKLKNAVDKFFDDAITVVINKDGIYSEDFGLSQTENVFTCL